MLKKKKEKKEKKRRTMFGLGLEENHDLQAF